MYSWNSVKISRKIIFQKRREKSSGCILTHSMTLAPTCKSKTQTLKKRRTFSFQAYQVQMKHYYLIFYILRLRLLEQYFNVWHNGSQVF